MNNYIYDRGAIIYEIGQLITYYDRFDNCIHDREAIIYKIGQLRMGDDTYHPLSTYLPPPFKPN
jgi:hypothetical protein